MIWTPCGTSIKINTFFSIGFRTHFRLVLSTGDLNYSYHLSPASKTYTVNYFLVLSTFFVALNTVLRLSLLCSYCPASICPAGDYEKYGYPWFLLAHPVTHRVVATVAEFCFYKLEADVLGLGFFGEEDHGRENTEGVWENTEAMC